MSYHLEIARNTLEIELAQAFRTNIFRNGRQFTDADEFDDNCLHFLIFDHQTDELHSLHQIKYGVFFVKKKVVIFLE